MSELPSDTDIFFRGVRTSVLTQTSKRKTFLRNKLTLLISVLQRNLQTRACCIQTFQPDAIAIRTSRKDKLLKNRMLRWDFETGAYLTDKEAFILFPVVSGLPSLSENFKFNVVAGFMPAKSSQKRNHKGCVYK